MKKAIAILSTLFLLTQGTAMAARAGRDRIDRGIVDTHGLTPVALEAENYYVLSEGFRTLSLPRKERFHLRADARSPQRIFDRLRERL